MKNIGYLGLGVMGYGMTDNLIRKTDADTVVWGYDPVEAARDRFGANGGKVAASAEELYRSCDVIFMCLPTNAILKATVTDIMNTARPGTIIVDMGASSPYVIRELHATALEKGFSLLDAPVSGGKPGADAGTLVIMCGGEPEVFVLNNLTPQSVAESVSALAKRIDASQVVFLPGGFSGGDEPDGSGKFITAVFRNPSVTEAVRRLLNQRDGLMLGICNGFQALIKLGLVPFGDIITADESCPTLTFNTIGRHQSRLVRTRVASNKSPWLMHCNVNDRHTVAISHGEGRLVASEELLRKLAANGQIATQYVDLSGEPSMDIRTNPNGSVYAIEGITSPDGRVLGKMGHSERSGADLYRNVPGNKYQPLFEGGMDYFKL